VQNIEKLRIYIYMAAAAAEIFINCLRQRRRRRRRRRRLSRSAYTSTGVSGTNGSTSTLLNNPLSIVLDSYNNMYISDTANHCIQLFLAGQSNGTTISGVTGSPGTSATQLNNPYWAILDSQLNLYVADNNNNRVQKFSRY
jgi:hypothetical protein